MEKINLNQLFHIVKESVEQILKEGEYEPIQFDADQLNKDKEERESYENSLKDWAAQHSTELTPYPERSHEDLERYGKIVRNHFAAQYGRPQVAVENKMITKAITESLNSFIIKEDFQHKYDHAIEVIEYYDGLTQNGTVLSPGQKDQLNDIVGFLIQTNANDNPNTDHWIELAKELIAQ